MYTNLVPSYGKLCLINKNSKSKCLNKYLSTYFCKYILFVKTQYEHTNHRSEQRNWL